MAVTNFKTHVLADLRQDIRIEKSDIPLGLLPGSKMTGIIIAPVKDEERRTTGIVCVCVCVCESEGRGGRGERWYV